MTRASRAAAALAKLEAQVATRKQRLAISSAKDALTAAVKADDLHAAEQAVHEWEAARNTLEIANEETSNVDA